MKLFTPRSGQKWTSSNLKRIFNVCEIWTGDKNRRIWRFDSEDGLGGPLYSGDPYIDDFKIYKFLMAGFKKII